MSTSRKARLFEALVHLGGPAAICRVPRLRGLALADPADPFDERTVWAVGHMRPADGARVGGLALFYRASPRVQIDGRYDLWVFEPGPPGDPVYAEDRPVWQAFGSGWHPAADDILTLAELADVPDPDREVYRNPYR